MHAIARRKVARHLAEQLHQGAAVAQLTDQAVAYLIEQKQTNQVELLIRDIEAELAERYNVVTARITTARPVDAQTRNKLTEFIKDAMQADQVVIAEESVDEDLIGGAVITTPNSTFDSSVRSKLRQLTATTKE